MAEKEQERIQLRCPRCDHPVAVVPPDYEFDEPLICPGCGAEVEAPHDWKRLVDSVADAAKGIVGKLKGGL